MKTTSTTKRKKILLVIILAITVLIGSLICYYIFDQSETIDTGIATLYKEYTDHREEVLSVRFSPDGSLIASGSIDSTIIIRKKGTGAIIKVLKQPDGITSLDFSPDGNYIVTGSYDTYVRIWNVAEGKLVKIFKGHTQTVWTVAFSRNGQSVASSGEDAVIIYGTLLRVGSFTH